MKIQEPDPQKNANLKSGRKGVQFIHELYEKLKGDLQDLTAMGRRKKETTLPLEKVVEKLEENDL